MLYPLSYRRVVCRTTRGVTLDARSRLPALAGWASIDIGERNAQECATAVGQHVLGLWKSGAADLARPIESVRDTH